MQNNSLLKNIIITIINSNEDAIIIEVKKRSQNRSNNHIAFQKYEYSYKTI